MVKTRRDRFLEILVSTKMARLEREAKQLSTVVMTTASAVPPCAPRTVKQMSHLRQPRCRLFGERAICESAR